VTEPTIIEPTEVARMLRLDVKSVYAGARAGEVPCRRVGRRYVFVREVILAWLLSTAVPSKQPTGPA
jgi:hypothetical protein